LEGDADVLDKFRTRISFFEQIFFESFVFVGKMKIIGFFRSGSAHRSAVCPVSGIFCFFGRIAVGIPFPEFFDFPYRSKSGDIFSFEYRVLFGSGIEKKIMAVVRIVYGFDRSVEIRLYDIAYRLCHDEDPPLSVGLFWKIIS
jgi:hypothetical protein